MSKKKSTIKQIAEAGRKATRKSRSKKPKARVVPTGRRGQRG